VVITEFIENLLRRLMRTDRDPSVGPKRDELGDRVHAQIGYVAPVNERQKLFVGKLVRRWAVKEGIRMPEVQEILDMLDVP
jgi:hypothetical protein